MWMRFAGRRHGAALVFISLWFIKMRLFYLCFGSSIYLLHSKWNRLSLEICINVWRQTEWKLFKYRSKKMEMRGKSSFYQRKKNSIGQNWDMNPGVIWGVTYTYPNRSASLSVCISFKPCCMPHAHTFLTFTTKPKLELDLELGPRSLFRLVFPLPFSAPVAPKTSETITMKSLGKIA